MTRRTLSLAVAAVAELLATGPGSIAQEAEILERGRLIYRVHCVNCHGDSGKGDGPLAEIMKIEPADLTGIIRRNNGRFPFEEIYRIIDGRDDVAGHGTRKMPIWGLSFQDPGNDSNQEDEVRGRILQLIRYLRSIQAQSDDVAPPDPTDSRARPSR